MKVTPILRIFLKPVIILFFFCIIYFFYYFLTLIYISHLGDPLERTWLALRKDPELGWISRPNLNTRFYNSILLTDSNGFRIGSQNQLNEEQTQLALFGPSSAFGWGVDYEETYGALIQAKNFSQIGYTIWQGHQLFKQQKEKLPNSIQFIILSYGINELDHFRFFDSEPKSDLQYFTRNHNISLNSFADWVTLPIQVIGKRIYSASLNSEITCPPFIQNQRMTETEYFDTLKMMSEEVIQMGLEPVLIETAYRNSDEHLDSLIDDQELISEINSAVSRSDCKNASQKYKAWSQTRPKVIAQKVRHFNKSLDHFANTDFKIPLIKINHLLKTDDFIDPVHFSKSGHLKISKAITETLHELKKK